MNHIDRWLVGGCFGVLGLFGLYLSSHQDEGLFVQAMGFGLFAFAVVFNFLQIKTVYDAKE